MANILLGVSIGLLVGTATAQIPMSRFTGTFTAPLTRGYFFQAPVDFVVTDLEVPDEAGKGEYLVALYKLPSAPPAFNQTLAASPVFFAAGIKTFDKAEVPATAGSFKKGDWVAVLGAAGGDRGPVSNSYGASRGAGNPSAILGTPIVAGLQRCGMQINIGTTKGVGGMWSEVSGPIARIKMTVRSPSATTTDGAQSCIYCPSSGGDQSLDVGSANPPIAGQTMALEMKSGGTANSGALLAFGLRRGDVLVPGVGRLCVLDIAGIVPFASTPVPPGPVGAATLDVEIPDDATLLGVKMMFQGVLRAPGSTVPLTNGLEVIVGR